MCQGHVRSPESRNHIYPSTNEIVAREDNHGLKQGEPRLAERIHLMIVGSQEPRHPKSTPPVESTPEPTSITLKNLAQELVSTYDEQSSVGDHREPHPRHLLAYHPSKLRLAYDTATTEARVP